ncbi:hypothetical protein A0J61_04035 [Choanephora cucurbitarum]|uniref:MI domain-containing protein n=1 Tax=Choanephora cucurbitarum TaxID=101091 RepID=A0A1C7NFP9_9FUNG|nr:hypothetical protein A0J61_04035 [Choanephora cucurbitarum]
MNRTPNTTEKTNAQPVFNYAQAAKRSSQNLETQKPKATPSPSTTSANETTPSSAAEPAKVEPESSKKPEATKDITAKSADAAPAQSNVSKAEETKPLDGENATETTSTRRESTQSNNSGSEQSHYYNNRHYGSRQGGKHNNHPSNMQSGYVPHHAKKNMLPNQAGGNWQNNQYYRTSQYYPPNTFMPVPSYTGQTFVPQPSVNKAIAIINPNTNEVINLSGQSSAKEAVPSATSTTSTTTPTTSTATSTEESVSKETKNFKITPAPSRAIKIVDPREKEEEAERKAKEEAEKKAKEEAEQKAKEEAERKAKEEAERKAKEEAEQKAKEEAEQKAKEEAEQKAKEEAEQKAKEEAERKAKEEAEKKAKEEAEQKAKEEAEQKAKEEAEQKAKEEAEKKTEDKAEKEQSEPAPEEKNVEERIAAIAADKAARGAPGRLDMSAIPAHVFHDSPASSPSSTSPPKVKGPPMRKIEDFDAIEYPPEFLAPKMSAGGRITYDSAFLLQFQKLCLETDEDLSEFQNMATEQPSGNERRSMSRRQTSERGGRGPRTPGGNGPNEGGVFRGNSRDGRGEMGKFSGGRPLSHRQGSNGPNSPGMERQDSRGGRNRSGRGGKGRHPPREQQGGPTIPLDQVVPLEKSENRWVPTVVATDGTASTASEMKEGESELVSQEIIARKIKSLLNKLTLEKFDSISDQIWEYAKQSEREDNGQSLRTVIQLIFDKACDEPNFAGMWAQLCRKLFDVISRDTNIKDVNILDKAGAPVSGGALYRKYLLNRCQQEFEKGWKSDLPKIDTNNPDVMMTDEYYAAVKAKRQGLGLVQFIGELFKRQMLTDRVMIECLTRLCVDPKNPEDEETETMCKMLTTIGRTLDTSSKKNKDWLDTYFMRMKEMYESETLSSRVKFMILDVFDLRKSKWVSKRGGNQPAPTTIAQIHEQAKKANEEKEKENMKRSGSSRGGGNPMSRQSSHRSNAGGGRDISRQNSSRNAIKEDQSGGNNSAAASADGWNTVGPGSPTTAPRTGRTNELANFGKTDRSKSRNSSVLGPSSSPFSSLTRSGSKSNLDKKASSNDARTSSPATSMSNMFSALGGDGQEEEPTERKKLQLLPRNTDNTDELEKSEEASADDNESAENKSSAANAEEDQPKLSDEAIERRCKGTIDEYFSLRDKTELCECVKELDHPHYRFVFARKLLNIVEKKSEDVEVVCEMIDVLYKEKLMTREEFVTAFKKFWEGYEDLVIDVPKAPENVNRLLAATGIERSEVECEPSY